jgi:hypothetical protein
MQDQVRILLGDTSTAPYTDALVQGALNKVFPEVAAEHEVLLTFDDYDVTQSVQRFTLKEAFLTVKRVEYHVSASRHEEIHYVDLDQFARLAYAQSDRENEPEYYKIEMGATETDNDPQRPGDLWLYPIPDTTTAAGYPNLRVWYYQMPTELSTGTDITELPIPLHQLCCYKAAADLAFFNKDLQTHASLTTMADRASFTYKQNSNRTQRDRPFFTQDVMGYSETEPWNEW